MLLYVLFNIRNLIKNSLKFSLENKELLIFYLLIYSYIFILFIILPYLYIETFIVYFIIIFIFINILLFNLNKNNLIIIILKISKKIENIIEENYNEFKFIYNLIEIYITILVFISFISYSNLLSILPIIVSLTSLFFDLLFH